jgi:hypothetical protein
MSLRDVERKSGNQTEEEFSDCALRSRRASAAERSPPFAQRLADTPGCFARELGHGMYSNRQGTLGDVDHPILLAGCAQPSHATPMAHLASSELIAACTPRRTQGVGFSEGASMDHRSRDCTGTWPGKGTS